MSNAYTPAPSLLDKIRSTILVILPLYMLLFGFYWFEEMSSTAAFLIGLIASIIIYYLSSKRLDREYDVKKQLSITQSDLKHSHQELGERGKIIEKMIDALPDPLIFLSKNRRCLRRNQAARDYFTSLASGNPLESVIRDTELLAGIDQVLASGEATTVAIQITSPVSAKFNVRILPIATVGEDGSNENSAILLAMQDMTKEARSETMRTDFVANVSHELRTPLTSLVGFAETLLGPAKDDPDAREQFLKIMLGQSERMLQIIQDLLSLSRIEVDEHARPKDFVDIEDALRKTCDTLNMKAEQHNASIQINMGENLPKVLGDEGQLIQVFQNLIDNAIKYGSDNGKKENSIVSVTVEAIDNKHLSISVKDQGKGIPKEALPRLTERFYRVDAARSRAMGGTGLGLAIVKHIINRHRGKLHVTSEIDEGSCFIVILPIA